MNKDNMCGILLCQDGNISSRNDRPLVFSENLFQPKHNHRMVIFYIKWTFMSKFIWSNFNNIWATLQVLQLMSLYYFVNKNILELNSGRGKNKNKICWSKNHKSVGYKTSLYITANKKNSWTVIWDTRLICMSKSLWLVELEQKIYMTFFI